MVMNISLIIDIKYKLSNYIYAGDRQKYLLMESSE